ncbi:MAG: hypothetical protein ACJ76P_07380 [Actinomycetota bacterium]
MRHPHRVSVARCENCGRTLCIACAVPVRNAVYGGECLSAVLGDDVGPQVAAAQAVASPGAMAVTAAFAVAAVGTALPWTRFQEGSGPFGAWGLSPRWSMLAAIAATCGLVVSVVAWREMRPALVTAARISAIVVVLATILAIARPPAFAPPWLGPWVTLAGGLAAAALSYGVVRPGAPAQQPERGPARSA